MRIKLKENVFIGAVLGFMFFWAFPCYAQEPSGKWSGYMFGDVYDVIAHHDKNVKGQNGVGFRRVYMTYDNDFGDNYAVRLNLEANQSDFTEKAGTLMQPFLKDAYLKWTAPAASHAVIFGLSPSPTFDEIEQLWGYRSVEKTPFDLEKWGTSRDVGLAARGFFDQDKTWGYHAMVGAGSDTRQETDKYKKWMLALSTRFLDGGYAQAYGDYEKNNDRISDTHTLQGFVGWKSSEGRIGVQYAHQVREQEAGPERHLDLLSVFTIKKLEKPWSVFARWDSHADPNPNLSQQAYFGLSESGTTNVNTAEKHTFWVVGADYAQSEGRVHLMPNVEGFRFGKNESGKRPAQVIIPRLTVFYRF